MFLRPGRRVGTGRMVGKDCKADCKDWRAEVVKTGRKAGKR